MEERDMKPERIQLFGPGGLFILIFRAVLSFVSHDDAADFSKTVRRIASSMGVEVSLRIDDRHALTVEVERDGEGEITAVERELAERISIAYAVLSSTPEID